jgi:hypothetical protein
MMAHVAHTSPTCQMPCGLSSVWRALRVLWKARVCERVCQGNAVDPVLLYVRCLTLPSSFRHFYMMASTFVPLRSICAVKYVDWLDDIESLH